MIVLEFLSFCISIALMLGLDVVLWMENPLYGIGGIVGIIAFCISKFIPARGISEIGKLSGKFIKSVGKNKK